ncbi:protease inhibitor I42 family protein [Frankia sp. CiP1_Cm_nod1]|uniref:protease inhibitor I42 family protein n=1 Tax=Frankia sp. CiP1_Cm_nod1 TaxID=2897160 RepID=UPI0040444CD8
MYLAKADAGRRRTVRVGEPVVCELPETPTTGYRWQAQTDPALLRAIGDRYEGPTEPRGAGGMRIFTFEPLQPGPVLLRLVKKRSWSSQVTDTFDVQLDVAD